MARVEHIFLRNNKIKYLVVSCLLVATIVGVALLSRYQAVFYNIFNDLKLTRQNEGFTELYIEDHLSLPVKIENGKELKFAFTIHNKEGKNVVYPYEVNFESEDGKTVSITKDFVYLNDGELRTTIVLTKFISAVTGTVRVILPDQKEEVRFILSDTNVSI